MGPLELSLDQSRDRGTMGSGPEDQCAAGDVLAKKAKVTRSWGGSLRVVACGASNPRCLRPGCRAAFDGSRLGDSTPGVRRFVTRLPMVSACSRSCSGSSQASGSNGTRRTFPDLVFSTTRWGFGSFWTCRHWNRRSSPHRRPVRPVGTERIDGRVPDHGQNPDGPCRCSPGSPASKRQRMRSRESLFRGDSNSF